MPKRYQLFAILLLMPVTAFGQLNIQCYGAFMGETPTGEELELLLEKHSEWLSSAPDVEIGDRRRANLCRTDLSGADLAGANLSRARLSHVNLSHANLENAILTGAEFDLPDLTGAKLGGADFSDAYLPRVDLSAAMMQNNQRGSKLSGTNLSGAVLSGANMSGMNLTSVDLSVADLRGVNFAGASLSNTNLSGSNVSGANLRRVLYDPMPGMHPTIDSIANAEGLSELNSTKPPGLMNLRAQLREGGYRDQERQVTYAINHTRTEQLLAGKSGSLGKIEGALNYVLFELTTKWGMAPSRALFSIVVLIFIFAIPYAYSISTAKVDGIWKIWNPDRVRSDLGSNDPVLLSRTIGLAQFQFGMALYFSVLSAFSIGWRDLNVGGWISRMQMQEYALRGSGWVRLVSGVQSLVSVYLLAIWVLSYFGRPFN